MIGKCHKCGNTVFSHKSKCSSCGTPINPQVFVEYNKPPEPPKPLTPAERKARNIKLDLLIVLAVITFVALIVCLITFVWGIFFDGSITVLLVCLVSLAVCAIGLFVAWNSGEWPH